MRAWRGPLIPPPSLPEPLRAGTPCRESPFVGTGIREAVRSPVAREALDAEETPMGDLLFPGRNLLNARSICAPRAPLARARRVGGAPPPSRAARALEE